MTKQVVLEGFMIRAEGEQLVTLAGLADYAGRAIPTVVNVRPVLRILELDADVATSEPAGMGEQTMPLADLALWSTDVFPGEWKNLVAMFDKQQADDARAAMLAERKARKATAKKATPRKATVKRAPAKRR